MSVTYILCEQRGNGAWHPAAVFNTKLDAVRGVMDGYVMTWDEEKRITRFVVSDDHTMLPIIIAGPLVYDNGRVVGTAPNRRLSCVP